MRLPWRRQERADYSTAVTNALYALAGDTSDATVGELAAVEVACQMYGAAFALASVEPQLPALSPAVLSDMARRLLRDGQYTAALERRADQWSLTPAYSVDVSGGATAETWAYRLSLPTPSGDVERVVPDAGVVCIRYATRPDAPWQGVSPLAWARETGQLAAHTERTLGDESAFTTTQLLPAPAAITDADVADGATTILAKLQADLKKQRGGLGVVESMRSASWSSQPAVVGRSDADWAARRLGPQHQQPTVLLMQQANAQLLAALGVPITLVASPTADALRLFIANALRPLAALISAELTRKLEAPVTIDLDQIMAADVASRARAVHVLTQAGADPASALQAAGFTNVGVSGVATQVTEATDD